MTLLVAILTAVAAPGAANVTVIIDLDEGRLRVQESWLLELEEPAAGGAVQIPLPGLAQRVVQPEEQKGFRFDEASGHVVNGTGLPKGRTHVFFNYDLPYRSSDVTVRRTQPDLRVSGMRIAVPELDTLRVQTPVPGNRSIRELEGVPFELIDILQPFRSGGPFAIELTGLPVRPAWPRWAVVVLCAILVLGTLALLALRRDPRDEAARPELQARKERLLQALRLLDDEKAAMDQAGYARRRGELLDELADVLRREAR